MTYRHKQYVPEQKSNTQKTKGNQQTSASQPAVAHNQVDQILNLQRTIGNQATLRLLTNSHTSNPKPNIRRKFDDPYASQHANNALNVAADILMNRTGRQLDSVTDKYRPTLMGLLDAVRLHNQPPATERLEKLEAATILLHSLTDYTSDSEWFETYIGRKLTSERKNIQYSVALERTQNAVLLDENTVLEREELNDPEKLLELLEARRGTLLASLNAVMGQVQKIQASPELRKQAEKMMKESGLDADKFSVAWIKGLALQLSPIKKPDLGMYKGEKKDAERNGWTDTAEATKAIVLAVKNMQMVLKNTGEVIYIVARVSGNPQLAKTAFELSEGIGTMLETSGATGAKGLSTALKIGGHLVTAIEIIHSIAVLLDPTATTDQKIDAAVGGAGAMIGIASAPLGAAIGLTWLQVKFMAASYWEVRTSIGQYTLNKAAEIMQIAGDGLSKHLDELAKAKLLLEKETDPEQREAMDKVIDNRFIPSLKSDMAYLYDALPVTVKRLFEDILKDRDSDDPAVIAVMATKALEQIMWCFANPKKVFEEILNP